jgi:hypothetical protein
MLSLPRLVHVAFLSLIIDFDVQKKTARNEARKTIQVAFVDCLDQCGNDRII